MIDPNEIIAFVFRSDKCLSTESARRLRENVEASQLRTKYPDVPLLILDGGLQFEVITPRSNLTPEEIAEFKEQWEAAHYGPIEAIVQPMRGPE